MKTRNPHEHVPEGSSDADWRAGKRDEEDFAIAMAHLEALGERAVTHPVDWSPSLEHTAKALRMTEDDVAKFIKAYVNFTNGHGHPEGLVSWLLAFGAGLDLNALDQLRVSARGVRGAA
jgi:hypothetical protein